VSVFKQIQRTNENRVLGLSLALFILVYFVMTLWFIIAN